MPAKTIMIQGTASSVGKSIIVAALCRILHQDGYKVAPFKAQNMALNSFVTKEGGEIGRAQAVQAEAAGIEPSVTMNPILLKPEADAKSQIIVLGKVAKTLEARKYYQYASDLLKIIEDSLTKLRSIYDIVVIEGAGSPAEINLKEREIVNMRVAKIAGSPVILVGDIDRGGIFASLIGTLELLNDEERNLIKGIIINKFRGDIKLLKNGLDIIEERCNKPVLGVIPYFRDISIAQEDSVYLDDRQINSTDTDLCVAVIRLPHISNYDDFDPLEQLGCTVKYISKPSELNDPDLIIIPGTKSTISDLMYTKQCGLAQSIIDKYRTGTPILGVCGGYQMLGKSIKDPYQSESKHKSAAGLGLLDIETVFNREKKTTQVKAQVIGERGLLSGMIGIEIKGYEIHMGQTNNHSPVPAFKVTESPGKKEDYSDGALCSNGMILGTYIHGLFHNQDFSQAFLNNLRKMRNLPTITPNTINKQDNYNKLAQLVRGNLDMSRIYKIIGEEFKYG